MGKSTKKAQEIVAEATKTAAKTESEETITKTTETLTGAKTEATEPTTAENSTENTAGITADQSESVEAAPEPVDPPTVTLDELEGMDMDSFAADNDQAGPRPAWRITDDGCADWAVQKIAEERAELARIKELADTQIQKIEEKVAAAERRCENGTSFLISKLAEYFSTVPHKVTKTKHSYRLLSGSLSMKLGQTQLEQDDKALLAFLKASGNDDMIQTTEKPKWGEYKKRLEIMNGSVVDKTTGEIVEGVQIVEKPDVFTVDV